MFEWLMNLFRYKRDPYPKTVEEVLDDAFAYPDGVHVAMTRFKQSKPWHDMKNKLLSLNADLAGHFAIEPPQVVFVRRFAYGSCYFPVGNVIIMQETGRDRFSVLTFLHEFGHALGKNEKETCKWSINLFRQYFPKSFAKLVPVRHTLRKVKSAPEA